MASASVNKPKPLSLNLKKKLNTMIKRTLYFGNPAYLNLSGAQIKVRLPKAEKIKP